MPQKPRNRATLANDQIMAPAGMFSLWLSHDSFQLPAVKRVRGDEPIAIFGSSGTADWFKVGHADIP